MAELAQFRCGMKRKKATKCNKADDVSRHPRWAIAGSRARLSTELTVQSGRRLARVASALQGGGSNMRALRFARAGSIDNLSMDIIDRPVPGPGEALVRVQAAAINPSDVKNVLGKMPMTTVPRTPGRDFAGVVEQGPSTLIGRPVFGSGGDLGFRRDGSHAEYLTVPVEAILVRPKALSPEQAAAIGLPYLTASAAILAAGLQSGETILITGATGAVGSAAARIASWKRTRDRHRPELRATGGESGSPRGSIRRPEHWAAPGVGPIGNGRPSGRRRTRCCRRTAVRALPPMPGSPRPARRHCERRRWPRQL
jgi:hypothetical protein